MRCSECISVSVIPAIGKPEASVVYGSDLDLSVGLSRSDLSISVDRYGDAAKVEIGIMCQTNIGTEYYLSVIDGCLLTLNGCLIKVSKG